MSNRAGHLKLIVLVALISGVVLIAMLELTLRFTSASDSLVEGDFSLQSPRHLVVREWLPNTTMHSSLQLIAEIIPERPDVVVINDTNDGGVLDDQKTDRNQHKAYRIVNHVDRSAKRGMRNVRYAIFPYAYRAIKRSIRTLRAFWQTMITGLGMRTAHAWDIRPLVLTQPILNEGEWKPGNDARADYLGGARDKAGLSFTDFKNRHDYFNGIAVWVAENHGAEHLDLANSREWTSRELYDGLHFTDSGAQHVAQYVASAISEMLDLVPKKRSSS